MRVAQSHPENRCFKKTGDLKELLQHRQSKLDSLTLALATTSALGTTLAKVGGMCKGLGKLFS
jgi:hypothetical protein